VLLAQPIDASIVPADDLSGGALPSLEAATALATGANADLLVLDRQIAEQTARRIAIALKTPDVTAAPPIPTMPSLNSVTAIAPRWR
jgi:hypothetical protein